MCPGCSLMRSLGNQGPRRMFAAHLERGGDKTRLTGPLRLFFNNFNGLGMTIYTGLPNPGPISKGTTAPTSSDTGICE